MMSYPNLSPTQLFERVTGLTQADFRLLVNLNLFNESLMNDAVYKFKRYEDASTSYHTMDWERHETVFLYNTEVSRELLEKLIGFLLRFRSS